MGEKRRHFEFLCSLQIPNPKLVLTPDDGDFRFKEKPSMTMESNALGLKYGSRETPRQGDIAI
jgi:hypothetical protein